MAAAAYDIGMGAGRGRVTIGKDEGEGSSNSERSSLSADGRCRLFVTPETLRGVFGAVAGLAVPVPD